MLKRISARACTTWWPRAAAQSRTRRMTRAASSGVPCPISPMALSRSTRARVSASAAASAGLASMRRTSSSASSFHP